MGQNLLTLTQMLYVTFKIKNLQEIGLLISLQLSDFINSKTLIKGSQVLKSPFKMPTYQYAK